MIVKDGTESDGSWFRSDVGGSAITGSTNIAKFYKLAVATFGGASAGDGVVITGGAVRVNRS